MTDSTVPTTVSVTVELPTSAAMRIATAVCARRGYGPTDANDAIRFVKETIFEQLRQETLEHEASIAAQQARDAVYVNPDDPLAYAVQPEPEQTVVETTPPVENAPVGATGATGPGEPVQMNLKR